MKKADILKPGEECNTKGPNDCRAYCPEYDTCDWCGRRVCKYVAVSVYHGDSTESEELICRPCARARGWNTREIETQAINPETHEYGSDGLRMKLNSL